MVCYSADPSKGFLSRQGIADIKAGLAKEIFRQELVEIYQKQTQSRNALNEDARAVMERLIEQRLCWISNSKFWPTGLQSNRRFPWSGFVQMRGRPEANMSRPLDS